MKTADHDIAATIHRASGPAGKPCVIVLDEPAVAGSNESIYQSDGEALFEALYRNLPLATLDQLGKRMKRQGWIGSDAGVCVHLADGALAKPVVISVGLPLPSFVETGRAERNETIFANDAARLFQALKDSLPGGTFRRLAARFVGHVAGVLAVSETALETARADSGETASCA